MTDRRGDELPDLLGLVFATKKRIKRGRRKSNLFNLFGVISCKIDGLPEWNFSDHMKIEKETRTRIIVNIGQADHSACTK